ncbi:hypothetical protein [Paracoccus albus]|uniref:hypothetical protein n=1 Tax=Paracoccus albus TaxID=3017784 RepID=UPI0022F05301|nr:hypothetical protein [Paracoccus albus]WBU59257.1 hypothetical protein PAF20_10725 [Paracoccus albus]
MNAADQVSQHTFPVVARRGAAVDASHQPVRRFEALHLLSGNHETRKTNLNEIRGIFDQHPFLGVNGTKPPQGRRSSRVVARPEQVQDIRNRHGDEASINMAAL